MEEAFARPEDRVHRCGVISALEDCIELGPSVGSDDLDRKRVEEMLARVRLLEEL